MKAGNYDDCIEPFTSKHSRSATLAKATDRIFCLEHVSGNKQKVDEGITSSALIFGKSLVIHVIGCSFVECKNEKTILEIFQPFIEWIFRFQFGKICNKIQIVLIGP